MYNGMMWGRRLLDGFTVLAIVFLIGVFGFKFFGASEDQWVDSFFMASITLTTVGYGAVTHLDTVGAKIFTSLYAVAGMGVLLYVVTTGTAFIVEGEAWQIFWKRRIRKMIEKLDKHFIICGVGRQGKVVAQELFKTGREFVIIEQDPEHAAEAQKNMPDVPILIGDATDNQMLMDAGIEKAKGLIACLKDDRDNLLLVVTAKQIKPDLRIVCKVLEVDHLKRLNRAGADSVVSPTLIGGLRMASEMIRPTVVTFLDKMLRDKDRTLRFEEVPIPVQSAVVEKTLDEVQIGRKTEMVVVAIKMPDSEEFVYAPQGDTPIQEGMVIVVIGDVNNISKVEKLVAPSL